ncbi:MAG: magnesium transporter [Deferrisomatales bacterium]|nr:magnesium transporter [Deferrisomatales bacterium]
MSASDAPHRGGTDSVAPSEGRGEDVDRTALDRLAARDWEGVRGVLAALPVPEVAEVLRAAEGQDGLLFFRLLPREQAAEVFSYLEAHEEDEILRQLTEAEARALLASIAPDDRTGLLEELPGAAVQKLLNLLSAEDLREARRFLGFPEESVGRLATPDYVAVRPDWTVAQALAHLRRVGRDSETIDVIYVTEKPSWRLAGVAELRRLILADPESTVSEAMRAPHVVLQATDDREEAVRAMGRYDLPVLPVVDAAGVLIGIVTHDDVFDVAQEEVTEDIHKTASVFPLRASYRRASVLHLYRKRVGWLAALLVISLLSSSIIAAFEETLARVVALAFFIPLLIGTGGNTGSQSAMLMVRALVTDDISLRDWFRTLLKELAVGALLGATLALGAYALGAWQADPRVGLVVGASLMAIVVVANLVGMLLPFLLARLRLDPTVASSPLITTIADAGGLLIYFGMATWLLGL